MYKPDKKITRIQGYLELKLKTGKQNLNLNKQHIGDLQLEFLKEGVTNR